MIETGERHMTVERLAEFGAAWTAGDLDALMEFVTDDCVYHASVGPEPGTTYRGREEVRRGFAEILRFDRGRERHGGTAFVHGDLGVAEWSFTEQTPGGERVIRGCDIFSFAGDKISKKDAFRKVLADVAAEPAATEPTQAAANGSATGAGAAAERDWAAPGAAAAHFAAKLGVETDPADVRWAMDNGARDFVIVDCRSAGNYNKAHIPGAISLPWKEITAERVRELPPGPVVTYCWGLSCNASTKGALRLARLGREVKELIGGLEYWIKEGHPTEGRRAVARGEGTPTDWGLVS